MATPGQIKNGSITITFISFLKIKSIVLVLVCSTKTRNKGRRRYKAGNYNRNLNYKASELRRLLAMDEEEMEYVGRIWRPNRCKYKSY